MSFIGDLFGGDSAEASQDAAEIQAQYQREALDYLKEVEALPRQYRDAAMEQLGSLYGLQMGEAGLTDEAKAQLQALGPRPTTQEGAARWDAEAAKIYASGRRPALESIYESPVYQALISGRGQGEEAILRNQAATGGLRSGGTQEALYDYNKQLESRALLQTLGGLQGFAQQPSNANQIAALTSGIGNTYAQGIVGGAQGQQAGLGMGINTGLGIANLIWSDRRLKDGAQLIGERSGHNWYRWRWNDEAAKLGLFGEAEGVIADEVEIYRPDAVFERGGYKAVDYAALGV